MKKSFSLGFKQQIDDYEPINVNVVREDEQLPTETEEEHTIRLVKGCVEDLELVVLECVRKIAEMKVEIFNDLSDGVN